MDFEILRAELNDDPLSRGYSGMDDEAASASLNAKDRTRLEPIGSAELLAWSASGGRLARLKSAAETGANDEVKSLAEAAYLMVTRDGTSLDLSLPDRVAFLHGLVAAGILTSTESDSLVSLATVSISRAEELGISFVRTGEVAAAR